LSDESPPTSDIPAQQDSAEQARTLRGLLRRHALDTRPLAIPAYRRLLIGQGTSFVGAMLTQVAVPVEVYTITRSRSTSASSAWPGSSLSSSSACTAARSPTRSTGARCTSGRRS